MNRVLSVKRSLSIVALIAATGAALAYSPTTFHATARNHDFAAYYCAGVVANAGLDIYRTEPLRSCENSARSRRGNLFVTPAPLPGYNVGIFRLLAKLPFAVASWLWFVLICSFGVVATIITIRIGRLPPLLTVAGMLFSVVVSAVIGQQVLISIVGILLLAWAFAEVSPGLALCGALLAATEPHLGAFAILSVLVWGKLRMRIAILGAGGLLLAASVAAQPLRLTAEYVRFVLPIHAISEINYERQYSLAYFLHRLGVNEAQALHASELIFVTLLLVALAAVSRVRRTLSPAIAILVPSALLLVAGPFVHITQLALGEPAALLLWRRTERAEFAWAALLLAMPWIEFLHIYMLAPLIVAAFAVLASRLIHLRPTYGILVATLVVALCTCLGIVLAGASSHVLQSSSATAESFAEVSWREEVDLAGASQPLAALLLKLPTFAGLILMAWAFIRAACGGTTTDRKPQLPQAVIPAPIRTAMTTRRRVLFGVRSLPSCSDSALRPRSLIAFVFASMCRLAALQSYP